VRRMTVSAPSLPRVRYGIGRLGSWGLGLCRACPVESPVGSDLLGPTGLCWIPRVDPMGDTLYDRKTQYQSPYPNGAHACMHAIPMARYMYATYGQLLVMLCRLPHTA